MQSMGPRSPNQGKEEWMAHLEAMQNEQQSAQTAVGWDGDRIVGGPWNRFQIAVLVRS